MRGKYPPGPKITPRNFGRDRPPPIANRWQEPYTGLIWAAKDLSARSAGTQILTEEGWAWIRSFLTAGRAPPSSS